MTGKRSKNAESAADLDGKDWAGADAGPENLAATEDAGPGAEASLESPADAAGEAEKSGAGSSDTADAGSVAALQGAAVAAGQEETTEEVNDGQEAGQGAGFRQPADGASGPVAGGNGSDAQGVVEPVAAIADAQQSGADGSDPDAEDQRDGSEADGEAGEGDTAEVEALVDFMAAAAGIDAAPYVKQYDHGAAPADIEAPMTVALLAREVAGFARFWARGAAPIDLSDVGFENDEAEIMAAFVRDNPDAPLLAMFKHLELEKHYRPTAPNNEDMLALSIFRHACLAGFEFERCEAAATAAPEDATPAPIWPGERAFTPEPGALDATGFSPL